MTDLLEIAKPYGVKGIEFGGCVQKHSIGLKGAMRRQGHAHCSKLDKWYGWICILSSNPYKRVIDKYDKPRTLFWHEVGHIYRNSWTEGQCDKFAWKQVRNS